MQSVTVAHCCPATTVPWPVHTRPFGPRVHMRFGPHPHCGRVSLHGVSLQVAPLPVLAADDAVPLALLALDAAGPPPVALLVDVVPPPLVTLAPPTPWPPAPPLAAACGLGAPSAPSEPCAHAPHSATTMAPSGW